MRRREFLRSSLALAALAGLSHGAEPPKESQSVASSNNQFAWDLYAQLRGAEGNLFSSPFSISTALAMTSVGARGRTAEQMAQVLHLPPHAQEIHRAYGTLLKQLNAADAKRGYQLSVANALWAQAGFSFTEDFLRSTQQNYGAGLSELDFENNPEPARRTINAWVEKETRDKIKELIKQGVIRGDTRLVLTNAIYFKGNWADQFDKKATFDEMFFSSEQDKAKTPMMHRTGSYGYLENDMLQALSIPYKGRELSMVFLLPRKKDALAEMEKTASPDTAERWLRGLATTDVIVTLPKFKMTSEFGLGKTLQKMGMKDAFTGAADFSGISAREGLLISEVVHKAFVEVNEEGAEAAAATAVVMAPTSAKIGPIKQTPVFRADHPFTFLIRENKSGAILFLGRMEKP